MKKLNGRPKTTTQELETILQKIEPYLIRGMSVVEACRETGQPQSSIYNYCEQYDWFLERIEAYKQKTKVLLSDFFFAEFMRIRQNHNRYLIFLEKTKAGEITELVPNISQEELSFMQWYAVNNKATRDDWGNRAISITNNNTNAQQNNQIVSAKRLETLTEKLIVERQKANEQNKN